MSKRQPLVSGKLRGQEMFQFEELNPPLTLSREYNEAEAKEMAQNRIHRIGELALTEQTKGFRYAVQGLWVPHSQTENMAVVRQPSNYMKQAGRLVYDKVFDKYRGDDGEYTVKVAQLAVWAQFADASQQRQLASKYDAWYEDANKKRLAMNYGLSFHGRVMRKQLEYGDDASDEEKRKADVVMGSIATYLADLKSYIGHPDTTDGTKRNWMQDRYVKKRAAHLAWTKEFLRKQPDWEFDRWFGESWYNHRSRAKFWYEVIHASKQMHNDIIAQRRINAVREDLERRGYEVDQAQK